MSLHYRASIQQNTGEDWRNTAVSVSTATPGMWSTIPALRALKIEPGSAINSYTKQMAQRHPLPVQARMQRLATSLPSLGQNSNTQPLFAQASAFGVNNNIGPGAAGQAPIFASDSAPNPSASLFGAARQAQSSTNTNVLGNAMAPHAPPLPAAAPQAPQSIGIETDTNDDWTSVVSFQVPGSDPVDTSSDKDVQWTETKAVVSESAVSSSFHIEGDCTIPSEPDAHKVAIALLTFEAKVNYVSVPRSAPVAFLQVSVHPRCFSSE